MHRFALARVEIKVISVHEVREKCHFLTGGSKCIITTALMVLAVQSWRAGLIEWKYALSYFNITWCIANSICLMAGI